MKSILYTIIFLTFLFSLELKAQEAMKFNPDSIPSIFAKLSKQQSDSAEYMSLWYKIKQDIEAEKGDNTADLFFLYKDRIGYHFYNRELDSLKKYTPIFKDICLQLHNEYYYYKSWDLLCDVMLFGNFPEEEISEQQKMYDDAMQRNSEIGMAYSTSRIGIGYITRREFAKAEPYLQQSTKQFEDMKYWDEYISTAANYIITLMHLEQYEEARNTFLHMDSLANSFIQKGETAKKAHSIILIKDMAFEVYKEQKDTTLLKKYLKEIDDTYRNSTDVPRLYLYEVKMQYAELTNNLSELIAYQDSTALFYLENNNMIGLSDIYLEKARYLYKTHKYKEAYQALYQHVELNDSIFREDFQNQLNEMSTRYNMNKLELDAQMIRMRARNMQYYYACALIVILLVTLIIGIKFYLHKLKSNHLLQKQAQELIHANEKVQKAQLMKTAFIQNMNHEVRTPLNSIVGFSECLASIPMSQDEIKEISSTIKKNSDNLLKIISDMLTIANMDSDESMLSYQNISVDTLCSDLVQEMQEYAQPGVKLYYSPCKTDYILSSHTDTVRQILTNLMHNALKFTQNGEVELSYRIEDSAKELRFYVRDTGPGVSNELKETIFERFYKVDSFVPGAGLGLSLCRVLAKRLEAQVYLDDSYKEGCLFVFAHPLPL